MWIALAISILAIISLGVQNGICDSELGPTESQYKFKVVLDGEPQSPV